MIQPAGEGGTPFRGQRVQRDRERVLHRFLGERDVAEEAHQHGNRTAVLAAEDRFDLARSVPLHERAHFDGRADGARELAAPAERGVEIGRLEDR